MMDQVNFDRVSRGRATTLSLVQKLGQKELDHRPDTRQWSVGEILDHLIKADDTYRRLLIRLIDLAKSGEQPSIFESLTQIEYSIPIIPRPLLPFADLPMGVLNLFVPSSVREGLLRNRVFAVEAPESLRPARGRPAEELRRGLIESLHRLESLFSDHPDADFHAFRYYHPLFGYNRVGDILSLLASHEQRHQEQLRSALRNLRERARDHAA